MITLLVNEIMMIKLLVNMKIMKEIELVDIIVMNEEGHS